MNASTICCGSCDRNWRGDGPTSVYRVQAIESCPCPHCGAYTLACREPESRGPGARRRPAVIKFMPLRRAG